MKLKTPLRIEDVSRALAIVLLLFNPLVGGYWWWSHIVVGVLIILVLVDPLTRTPQRIITW